MSDYDQETLSLLKLSLCERVGPVTVNRLIEAFGSAAAALEATEPEIACVEGLSADAVHALRRGPGAQAVEAELQLIQDAGVELLPISSDNYPTLLKHLGADAPPLLWTKGRFERRDALAVAVVGSRRCSAYGRAQARRFAIGLSGMGFTIVSGLAWGIDAEAHRATLQVKGRTVAVVGCGLDALRRDKEWELACEISQSGAVVSELPMSVPPRPENFPPRNRLISGLSLGVVVVEAAKQSGTLITARWAGEQGRAIFAVPGNVDSPCSQGCHQLIRDGAVLADGPQAVLEGLGPLSEPLALPAEMAAEQPAAPVTLDDARAMGLNKIERQVFDAIGHSPMQIDAVIERTGLPASVVSSTLLTLEIRGIAKQLPGQCYVRR